MVWGLVACGGDFLSQPRGCDGALTASLIVNPEAVTRDAHAIISVEWQVYESLSLPRLRLSVGDDTLVEVELPMHETAEGSRLYRVEALNPFGAGAPVGEVTVFAFDAGDHGCAVAPSATSNFLLN